MDNTLLLACGRLAPRRTAPTCPRCKIVWPRPDFAAGGPGAWPTRRARRRGYFTAFATANLGYTYVPRGAGARAVRIQNASSRWDREFDADPRSPSATSPRRHHRVDDDACLAILSRRPTSFSGATHRPARRLSGRGRNSYIRGTFWRCTPRRPATTRRRGRTWCPLTGAAPRSGGGCRN